MVLGIAEYLAEDEKNKELDFIHFKKYFQPIYKKTGCQYKNWLHEMKERDKMFGASISKSLGTEFINNIYMDIR